MSPLLLFLLLLSQNDPVFPLVVNPFPLLTSALAMLKLHNNNSISDAYSRSTFTATYILHLSHLIHSSLKSSEMSFCRILNRNQRNNNSQQYLENTARKLRHVLQKWIINLINSSWMYTNPIRKSIEDDALFFPLALIDVNHQGIQPLNNHSFPTIF